MNNVLRCFPYKPRFGQDRLISLVAETAGKVNLCFEAPTGFGKTPAVLAGLITLMKRGYHVVWAVRTGNEADRVIEELKVISDMKGCSVYGISYRGKRDMCLLARLKYGELDYDEVSYLCGKMKDCSYKVKALDVELGGFTDQPLIYSEILEMAERLQACPYFLQRRLLRKARLVSLSYNYILHPGIRWSIMGVIPYGRSILVVDEAHNLEKVASNINTARITLGTVRRALSELEKFETTKSRRIMETLLNIESFLSSYEKELRRKGVEDDMLETERLLGIVKRHTSLDGFIRNVLRYGSLVRLRMLRDGKKPRSSLRRLGEFMQALTLTLNVEGVAHLASLEDGKLTLEVWDMRSPEILGEIWGMFASCIFMSGTLRPIKGFAEVVGLKYYRDASYKGFIREENVKVYITSDLSSEGERISVEAARKYALLASALMRLETNIAVFSASYRVQNAILPYVMEEAERQGYRVYVEKKGMRGDEARRILEMFKKAPDAGEKAILMASTTGRFAEGADFPGRQLQAVLIAGLPFDKPTLRTKLYLQYYKKIYGPRKGVLYGYVVPALRRAAQAMGRALRSERDRAVYILGDKRYFSPGYLNMLPQYARSPSVKSTVELTRDIPTLKEFVHHTHELH